MSTGKIETNDSFDGVPLIDNDFTPDIYADAVTGYQLYGGTLRITLERLRARHTPINDSAGTMARVVIGRLVMPLAGAESLACGILQMIEQNKVKQLAIATGAIRSSQAIN